MIQVGIGYFLFAVCSMTQSTEQNCVFSASAYWKPCSFDLWIVHSFIPDPVLRAHYTKIFSCSLLLCPEFYAQSTTFIFFYKWCKITYFAIVNLVLSSFAFLLFISFSIDHRSLNFAFLLINNTLLPTKNCPSCCGYHKL